MKNISMGRFGISLAFLLSVHCVALAFFALFRWVLYCSVDYVFPADVAQDYCLQGVAFVRGLWFDNVIACYVLLLPLVMFWVAGWFNYTAKWLYRSTAAFFILSYALSFIISAANIPYFCYFFKTINSSIFNWFGYAGTTAGMVFGETSYYFPIALGVVAIVAFGRIVVCLARRFHRLSLQGVKRKSLKLLGVRFLSGAVLVALCLFGIRGRRGYNPIKVSQAYYCNDPFLNQLGVNPVFNLLTSALDDRRSENKALSLMPEEEALANVQEYLCRTGIEGISPIAREVKADGIPSGKNVVVILMESMSAHLMGTFGHPGHLTPFLDSLYNRSLSFCNFYSSGIHTNHGMYSSLYSFPAIMKRNAMKGSVIPLYSGLPTVLKDNGYRNLFFMTHESQYDNMNAFFRTNGFDEIYSQENYPSDKVVNGFGVQDDFLFTYALPVLNRKAEEGKPFFCVLLTISNHPPYVIPPSFHPHSEAKEEQIVEYADASIRDFMEKAACLPWADETVFVLLGDHGKLVGSPECESPESYNHIPLMIYGKGIEPRVVEAFGGQVDLAPTLLGLLNISYVQNNFGVDLLREQRPCMFFTADNLVGARDSSRLFVYIPDSRQELHYQKTDGGLVRAEPDSVFGELRKYCFSMLQGAECLVRRQQTVDGKSGAESLR